MNDKYGVLTQPVPPRILPIYPLLSTSLTKMVGTFIIINKPMLTHNYHPKSIVYIWVISWENLNLHCEIKLLADF